MVNTALEALKCPQCEGNVELDSNQEYGFCKYCGTKVQNSNFKKIKIVGNPTIENFIKLAEREYDDKNYEEALEKYNRVLDINPDDWKAVYRRGVCIAKTTTLGNFKMDSIVKGSKNAIKIINNDNKSLINLNQIRIDMAYDIIMTCHSMHNFTMNHYNKYWELESSAEELWNKETTILNAAEYVVSLLYEIDSDTIKTTYSDESKKDLLAVSYSEIIACCIEICKIRNYKKLNNMCETWINNEYRKNYVEIYDKYSIKLRELEPNSKIELIQRVGKQGCYVATCVYGSYDCPQVWILRRYRDNNLAKTWHGKLFIHTYYTFSPIIVKLFGKTQWFKNIFKPKLDKFVNKLKQQGYESSPYNDKEW